MVKLSEIRVDEALEATLKGLGVAAAVIGAACAESAAEGVIHVFVFAILSHVQAVAANGHLLEVAERSARTVQDIVKSLTEADFPPKCPAFLNVTVTLARILVCIVKYKDMSWWKRSASWSVHTFQTNALKYKKQFMLLHELLRQDIEALTGAVVAKNYQGLEKVNELLQDAAASSSTSAEEHRATTEELKAKLEDISSERAEFEDRMALILEEIKVKLAEGASAAQAAAAAAEAAATALSGGASVAPEVVAELCKELLEGVVPVLLQSLADEGKLTREQVKASAAEVKAEIGSLRGELDAKIDMVTFLSPSPPLVFILAR